MPAPGPIARARSIRARDGLDRHGPRLLGGCVLLHLAVFACFFVGSLHLFPLADMLDWIATALASDDPWRSLFTPHNGQRIVASRLLATLHGRQGLPLGAIIAVAALSMSLVLALVLREIWRAGLPRGLAWLATAGLALLGLRTYTLFAWVNPTHVQQALALAFFTASMRLATDSIFVSSYTRLRLLAALGLATCASLSSGQGLLIWGALVWLALRHRMSGRRLGLVLACAGAVGVAYFHGVAAVELASGPGAARPLDHLLLAIHCLGQPWVKVPVLYPLGLVTGLGVAALSFHLLLRRGLLGAPPERAAILPLSLVGLGVASAALVGVLRASEGALAVTRYGVFTAFTQVGVLVLLAQGLAPRWRSDRLRLTALACAIGAALLLLPEQVVVGLRVREEARRVSRAALAIRGGDRSEAVLREIYPRPERARKLLAELERHDLLP